MMEDANKQKQQPPNIKGDRLNIVLLIFLYVLQGIPSGLSQAIQLILQNRKASYADQAGFSFVSYSFCFKLLWAPVVDCVYSKRMGRRKTWLIPTQYLIGIGMWFISMNVEDWLGSEDGTRRPKIQHLTGSFFLCIFFASTQDIVVDGWSLTMLQKRNVGHSGTCNIVGYAIGQLLAFVLFIVLDSKEICNQFRTDPQDHGFVSFADFLFFWAMVFIVTTTLILIFKKDNSLDDLEDDCECRLGLKESYKYLWQIVKIKPIQIVCFLLLTSRIGFASVHGVGPLKLLDGGVPRDNFALLTTPSLPFQLILPFLMSKHLTGPRSMRAFLFIYIFKLTIGIVYAVIIYFTSYLKYNETLPTWYYWLLLLIYNIENLTGYGMSLTCQAFLSRISDPRFGGIYLTLMNTMWSLGYKWPVSLCLWLVDIITIKSCPGDVLKGAKSCYTILDGFYIETIVCTLLGLIWFCWNKKLIHKMEKLDPSAWVVERTTTLIEDKLLPANISIQ